MVLKVVVCVVLCVVRFHVRCDVLFHVRCDVLADAGMTAGGKVRIGVIAEALFLG